MSPDAAGGVVAFVVYARSEEYPQPVPLVQYIGSKPEIRLSVMARAEREGFKGSFDERMTELGWWIEPLVLQSDLTAAQAEADRLRELLGHARDCAVSHLGMLELHGWADGVNETGQLIASIETAIHAAKTEQERGE